MNKRKFLNTVISIFVSILIIVVVLAFSTSALAAQSLQVPISVSDIPMFTQELPLLDIGGAAGTGIFATLGNRAITLRMCEFKAAVLPDGAVNGYEGTWVWGYLYDPTGNSSCADLINSYGDENGVLSTYLGPVIVNERGSSTDITFVNNLGTTALTNVLAYKYSTDQTLHWADPLAANAEDANMCHMKSIMKLFPGGVGYPPPGDPCAQNYAGPIAAVPHLHGGEVPPEIDGGPDSWFTSDGLHLGSRYYTAGTSGNSVLFKYPNTQPAAPLWFHDHTLGATRLNVYAGLAGGYMIEDPAITPVGTNTTAGIPGTCKAGCLPANLPPLSSVIPLIIQDRMFDSDGQLFFPADSAGGTLSALNPEHPYWVPEFIGDTIVVNGKAWPYINVEPKRYRFLFLEGSNARPYNLSIDTGSSLLPFYVIGTDGGYLDKPAPTTNLLMLPGERYDVIIDFSGISSGTNLVLKNDANAPYPDGDPVDLDTTGKIVQFRVGDCTSQACGLSDKSYNPASGKFLRSDGNSIVRLVEPKVGKMIVKPNNTRVLTLNEIAIDEERDIVDPVTGSLTHYPGGPEEILVNNTTWVGDLPDMSTRPDFTAYTTNGDTINISEKPQEGQTEMWEIVNLTMDAHPIHLHLTTFQLINRQAFDMDAYNAAYTAAFGTNLAVPLPEGCTDGEFCPAYGPPLAYDGSNPLSGGKLGGNVDIDKSAGKGKMAFLLGKPIPPKNYETGWLDTVVVMPGQVTRIAVRWAPTDITTDAPKNALYYPFDPYGDGTYAYVWHCHIIDHEDNEMMRPDVILLNPDAPVASNRPLVQGIDY
jgi:FtsP/CotA-like multicopper oxidase with cupredoxin domain